MSWPVLSPVRWWRSDADRYVTRGAQVVPAAAQDLDLMFQVVRRHGTEADAELTPIVADHMYRHGCEPLDSSATAAWDHRADMGPGILADIATMMYRLKHG